MTTSRDGLRAAAADATDDGDAAAALASSGTIKPHVKERLDLLANARKEHAAVQSAKALNKPIPATPNLDELNRRQQQEKEMATTNGSGRARSKVNTDMRLFHDGQSLPETHRHKISTFAYFYTWGIESTSSDRMSTVAFLALLDKLGVKDPNSPGWMVKLPNGVTAECRKPNERSQFKGDVVRRHTKAAGAPPAKKPAATAPTAKKSAKNASAAKKTTPAEKRVAKMKERQDAVAVNGKPPAKKAAAKQVEPNFKKEATKKAS